MAGDRGFGYTRGRSTKTMNVVYEQPAKFNCYVDDSIPLSWHRRWRSLKPAMPWVVFWYVTMAEILAVRRWLADGLSPSPSDLPFALLTPLLIIALLLLPMEGLLRIRHRSKRVLMLRDRWVSLSPSKVSQVRWKHIRGWRFAPIQNEPELTKLTVLLGPAKQGGWRRCWSMVLVSPRQKDDLVARLESRRDSKDSNYEVRVLTHVPPPPKPDGVRGSFVVGMLVYLLGMFLLLHSVPPLAFGVSGFKEPPRASQSPEPHASQPKERLRAWLAGQFVNAAELRRYLLVIGGALAACSAASMVGGSLLMNRSIRRTWVSREAEVLSPK
jgi:hypothetical protein